MLPSTEDAATPFLVFRQPLPRLHRRPKTKRRSASPEEMPKPSPKMFIAMLAIGVTTGSFFSAKQNFGPISQIAASGGQVSPATRSQPNEFALSAHLSFPTAKHFLYAFQPTRRANRIKVGVLGKARTRWNRDCPALVRYLLPAICFSSAPDTFRPSAPSIRVPLNAFRPILKPSAEARTFSCLSKRVFSPTTKVQAESELKLFDRSGNLIGTTPGPLAVIRSAFFSRR